MQKYYFYDILSKIVDWTAKSDTTSLQWSESLWKVWSENQFDSEIRKIDIATSFRLKILTKAIQVTKFSQLKLKEMCIFSWWKLSLFERRCNSEEERNWFSRMIDIQKRHFDQKKNSSDLKTCKKQTVKARIKEWIWSNVNRSTRNDISFSKSIKLSVVHQIKEEKRKASWSIVTTAKERKKNFNELRSKNKIMRFFNCFIIFAILYFILTILNINLQQQNDKLIKNICCKHKCYAHQFSSQLRNKYDHNVVFEIFNIHVIAWNFESLIFWRKEHDWFSRKIWRLLWWL